MRTMSDIFRDLDDVLPVLVWLAVWVAVFPVRMMALFLIPLGASERENHPLHKVREFFAFK